MLLVFFDSITVVDNSRATRLLLQQFQGSYKHIWILYQGFCDFNSFLSFTICYVNICLVCLHKLLDCLHLLVLDGYHEWCILKPPGFLVLGCNTRPVSHLIKHLFELNVSSTGRTIPHSMKHLSELALFIERLRCLALGISRITQSFLV